MIELLLTLWIFWLSYESGRYLLILFGFKDFEKWESGLFSIGLGLGLLANLLFAIGQLNLVYRFFVYVLLILVSLYFILYRLNQNNSRFLVYLKNLKIPLDREERWLVTLLGIVGIINLLGTMTPELRHDSMQYHMSIPHYYLLHHKMLDVPYTIYHFYSLNMEMLYTLSILLSSPILGKMIHAGLAILTAYGMYKFSKRFASPPVPLLSAALFYSLPQVAWMSSTTFHENGWMFYGLISVISWYDWWKTENPRWLYLTAFCCGLGMTIKLIVIAFYPFILGMATLLTLIYRKKWDSWYLLLIYPTLVFIPVFPWLIRNYIYTLNPCYPLLTNLFQSYSDYLIAGSAFHNIRHLPVSGVMDYIHRMSNAFFYIQVNGNSMLGLFLLALLILMMIWKNVNSGIKLLIIYCISVWLIYILIEGGLDGRFIYPCYPFMGIIAGYAFIQLLESVKRMRSLYMILIILGLLITFLYGKYVFHQDFNESVFPVLGKKSQAQYLGKRFPLYPVYEFVNEKLPGDANIILPAGYGAYYCDRKYIANSEFDESPLAIIFNENQSMGEMIDKLSEWRITHLVVPRGWVEMPRSKGPIPIFVEKHTDILFQTRNFALLEIRK